MPKMILGNIAKKEIRDAMRGLTGSPAKREAERLARIHNVKWQYIYKITKDLRDGVRKTRADKGKRTYELVEGTDVWYAAQLVIADKIDPDEALRTTQLRRPDAKLPSLGYFQQMLAENQLGKKQLRSYRRPYRRWEAEYPGQIFQIDCTALKVRWQDEKTRRILRIDGIDKNHPQLDNSKLRVWQIMLVDDCSRRRFLRYVSTLHITSRDIVQFEIDAFDLLGIPQMLYTDNGSEFKGHHIAAERILNSALKDEGGYCHITHLPHNAQATGKVENAHKWAEKMDRLVGLAVTEGQIVTIDRLNEFADRICEFYNNKPHRSTGESPMFRWSQRRTVIRKLAREVVESALLSDHFTTRLDASMTVAKNNEVYRIPAVEPFLSCIGKRLQVIVPPSIPLLIVTLPNSKGKFEPDHGGQYEIDKVLATADAAGEFRSVADGKAESLKKRLMASRKEDIKAIKAKKDQTGQIAPIPHFNVPVEVPVTNVATFPHPERIISAQEVAAVTPIPTPVYTGREIGYWAAVGMFADRFSDVDEAKQFLLSIFPDTEGSVPETEVEELVNDRGRNAAATRLRAVS